MRMIKEYKIDCELFTLLYNFYHLPNLSVSDTKFGSDTSNEDAQNTHWTKSQTCDKTKAKGTKQSEHSFEPS